MIVIDGSQGEGGGQIVRSALALSMATGQPCRIEHVRGGRAKPGLLRQHLTALKAAAAISGADVDGGEIGSTTVSFAPQRVRPGEYQFAVGSAGSATLVLQTVLPPLLTAPSASHLVLEGGTHNPWAPPYDFLRNAFLPLIERMGARVQVRLERPGFYPAGGGRFRADIVPVPRLARLDLCDRGVIVATRARAVVAKLPLHIAQRELRVVHDELRWDESCLVAEEVSGAAGSGNIVSLEIESQHVTEVFTGFGQVRVRAEIVAQRAVEEARRYLRAGVPVGCHLADQLLLPLALAGGGSFRTLALSRHATTNIDIIRHFLAVRIDVEAAAGDDVCVHLSS